ncbi:non-ribosomal peptide synthetase [Yeosuana marina]|uniref:non-ribosomal peptide synthetase n=1 Tax=Yeosuana marina TaxID=1565536 RepID=UPI0030C8C058
MQKTKDITVLDLFLKQVELNKNSIALVFEGKSFTYKELDEFSNQVANYLLEFKNVKVGDIVGIKLERSVSLVPVLLGIMKVGAAYVPIDPGYPPKRIAYIAQNSDCKLILDEKELEILNSLNLPVSSEFVNIPPQSLAYVIYTSGTTGKPKGVMITHEALLNRLLWAQEYFQLQKETDVVLQKTTYCFDVSVWEFFWPLIAGIKLVLARPNGQKDNTYLKELIIQENITTIHFVPSLLDTFLSVVQNIRELTSLKRILCSGEELHKHHIKKFIDCFGKQIELYNLYGPTEAAIDVTCWKIPFDEIEKFDCVPIGSPISNTEIYILNNDFKPCEIGVEGEIFISGVQVSKGYLNNEELSKERFLSNSLNPGSKYKMYRTGDMGRWRLDGTIQFLGRKDQQIKLRGYRIELGEIEHALQNQKGIQQSAVAIKEYKGDQRIVAYIVNNKSLSPSSLRNNLKTILPEYMIPSHFIELESLPLTSNGKLNRKALPDLTKANLFSNNIAPNNEVQKKLIEIWVEILKVDKVGITDNFMDLGGHSLHAIRILHAIEEEFKLKIPLDFFFQNRNIKSLGDYINLINPTMDKETYTDLSI